MINVPLLIIILSFVLLVIVWTALLFPNKQTEKNAGGAFLRIIFYIIIVLVVYLQNEVSFLASHVWTESNVIKNIAPIVTVLGLSVMFWARFTLGKNWSANIVLKKDHQLVTSGPYAYIRHPIYGGLILMILGVALYINSFVVSIFFLVFIFGAYYKAKREEKLLIENFKEEYLAYKQKTKMLVPYLF